MRRSRGPGPLLAVVRAVEGLSPKRGSIVIWGVRCHEGIELHVVGGLERLDPDLAQDGLECSDPDLAQDGLLA